MELFAQSEVNFRLIDWAIAITMPLVCAVLTMIVGILVYFYKKQSDHGERITTLEAKQVSRHDFVNLQQTVTTLVAVVGAMQKQSERMETKVDRLLEAGDP